MKSHRVAIISDTHGLLRPEVIDIIKTCEAVFHAGDIGSLPILNQLQEIGKTYAVRGNVDKEWAKGLPQELEYNLLGFQIYMVHNIKQIPSHLPQTDIVIYGHSHKYKEKAEGNLTYLNPGSCGPRRFHLPVTMMTLTLFPEKHCFTTERIDLVSADKSKSLHVDMHKLITESIKQIKNGKSIEEIAARSCVDRELAEQICRMYLTHPGIDADGILNRIEKSSGDTCIPSRAHVPNVNSKETKNL